MTEDATSFFIASAGTIIGLVLTVLFVWQDLALWSAVSGAMTAMLAAAFIGIWKAPKRGSAK